MGVIIIVFELFFNVFLSDVFIDRNRLVDEYDFIQERLI